MYKVRELVRHKTVATAEQPLPSIGDGQTGQKSYSPNAVVDIGAIDGDTIGSDCVTFPFIVIVGQAADRQR